MELDAQIEALLFYKAEAVSIKKLAALLDVPDEKIQESLKILEDKLRGRGLSLMHLDGEVMLTTAKELSPIIEKATKEELVRDLGKAGLETIAIILYQSPISRAEIDYIRGVNSNFILRNLLIRGLVEKVPNPKDQRGFLYKPTFELLSYLGTDKIESLPDFEKIKSDIELFKQSEAQAENTASPEATK